MLASGGDRSRGRARRLTSGSLRSRHWSGGVACGVSPNCAPQAPEPVAECAFPAREAPERRSRAERAGRPATSRTWRRPRVSAAGAAAPPTDVTAPPTNRHCMTATSSQRLNLRPTSRSMPTSSKPHLAWRRRRGLAAGLDAGHDRVEAAGAGDVEHLGQQQRADAETAERAVGRTPSPRRVVR